MNKSVVITHIDIIELKYSGASATYANKTFPFLAKSYISATSSAFSMSVMAFK